MCVCDSSESCLELLSLSPLTAAAACCMSSLTCLSIVQLGRDVGERERGEERSWRGGGGVKEKRPGIESIQSDSESA